MTVDQQCKQEILIIIKSKLSTAKLFLGAEAKSMALGMLQNFINTIPQNEYNLNLSEFLARHPEVSSQHSQAIFSLPKSAYQYTMKELVECLCEIEPYI